MNQTRVKICGITRVDDAVCAQACGADAIGLVFYDKSPRAVDMDTARLITQVVGPFVNVVGLFVNATAHAVATVINEVGIDLIQFHGDETEAFCTQFGRPYLKAIRMHPELDPVASAKGYISARGILYDAWLEGKYGGTGESFDWVRVPHNLPLPIILAGGLNPTNVAEAVRITQPYAVDVSGGVEEAPGIKSEKLIRAFIQQAKSVNQ